MFDHSNWEQNDPHLKRYFKQAYQRPSLEFDPTPGIHTLLGPRRIGKSTQFKLWIKNILAEKNIATEQIQYIDGERFETWQELYAAISARKNRFLFVDEATAPKDWERAFKIFSDEGGIENTCVWLTGSNAFALKNSGERLPGRRGSGMRIRDAEVLPLRFKEFYEVVQARKNIQDPTTACDLFLKWGGYPVSVSEYLTHESVSHEWLQELLDVVLGETSRQHRSPRLSLALSERIWLNLSSQTSYQALSKMIDMGSHPIIRQYLEILQGCYTLVSTERYSSKTKTGVLRKEKKFYFLDSMPMQALVSYAQKGSVAPEWLSEQLENPAVKGKLVENLVATELRKRDLLSYYDEAYGGEIDFVMPYAKELPAIEVKLSMPSFSEIKPMQAYPKSEVWVYNWKNPPLEAKQELNQEKSAHELLLGNIKVCSLIHRLLEF